MVDNSNKLEEGWLTSDSKISIVVPCYNEEECLTALAREMKRALDPLDYDWEVLLINDCSTDSTWKMMKVINHWDSRFKAIHLAYNSGQTAGTLAGIRNSTGDSIPSNNSSNFLFNDFVTRISRFRFRGYCVYIRTIC